MSRQDRKSIRYRRLLEMAFADAWHGDKKELRLIYAALYESGYNVLGYVRVLKKAERYAQRVIDAIAVLERTNDEE